MSMMRNLIVFGLLINVTLLVSGFSPAGNSPRSQTALFQHGNEMDRRVAMATAAALASGGALALQEPANAIGFSELSCYDMQLKNTETVNTNGDPTKHIPTISLEPDPKTKGYGQILTMSVPHVMDPEKPHFIEYMWLYDLSKGKTGAGNIVAVKKFQATDASPPKLVTTVASGRSPNKYASITKGMILKPYIYCNLHGLWEGETVTL